MIQAEIIQALLADVAISAKVQTRITPFSQDLDVVKLGTTLVYKFNPFSNDKVKRTDRLELRIIANTLFEAMETAELVNECLLTFGDSSFNKNILTIAQNGGGSSEDLTLNKVHYFLFYDVVSRA